MAENEKPPQIIFDDEADATPAQREAMSRFEAVAGQFSEDEMREALAKIERDHTRGGLKAIEPQDTSKLGVLAAAWSKVLDTDAVAQVKFDDTTEQLIQKHPVYIEVISQYGLKRFAKEFDPNEIRRQVVRERFAIFAGRLAAMDSVPQEENNKLDQAS